MQLNLNCFKENARFRFPIFFMAPSLHSIIPENRNKQMLKQEEEAHTLFSLRNRTTLELGLHVDRRFNTHNSIDATRREPKIEANRDITEKKKYK